MAASSNRAAKSGDAVCGPTCLRIDGGQDVEDARKLLLESFHVERDFL